MLISSHVSLRGFSVPIVGLDLGVAVSQEAGDGISVESASSVKSVGCFSSAAPTAGKDAVSRRGPRAAVGNVSLLSLWVHITGSCHARHQAGHGPGPGPLRACELRQRHLGPGPYGASCPWGFCPGLQPPAPWMASKMVISARPKILLQLIHKDKPRGPGASIREQVLEVPAQKES